MTRARVDQDRLDEIVESLGYESLRPEQRSAIEALVEGHDVLAVIPTGGGKSAIYQIAAELRPGATVVVSPLLALQADQVRAVEEAGLSTARSLDGSTSDGERADIIDDLRSGDLEYLFTTPEILNDDEFLDQLAEVDIDLFAVDEAHCIVTWGQSFRPDFLVLGDVRQRLGMPPTVALTASADPRIRADICQALDMEDAMIITEELLRSNIHLSVEHGSSRAAAADRLVDDVAANEAKTLVYVPTRKLAEDLAERFTAAGRRALPYHGGLRQAAKDEALDMLRVDGVPIVVATTAFGMGIDVADITHVAHLDMPESLIAYYQEVGRAGRNGAASSGTVYMSLRKRSRRAFASGVRETSLLDCAAIHSAVQDGIDSRRGLVESLPLSAGRIARAVSTLARAGALATRPRLRVTSTAEPSEIEQLCQEQLEFDRSQLRAVERYRSVRRCRWAQIMTSFGEPLERCGHCDACDASTEGAACVATAATHDDRFGVGLLVEHDEFGPGRITTRSDDIITVAFHSVGPKDLDAELCIEHDLITAAPSTDTARSSD